MKPFFDHEKLKVHQSARRFNREVAQLLKDVPRGAGESKDNLERAAKSITRNIAEGSGKWRIPDKIRFYHIARASAAESAASLDELVDYELLPEESIAEPRRVLAEVVAMLIGLARSLEQKEGTTMDGS